MPETIYLDHNATTPPLPEVLAAMGEAFSQPLLNPASQHGLGRRARSAIEDAKERIAQIVGAETGGSAADRIVITSGGTEANNLALFGLVGGRQSAPGNIIVSAIEHPSIAAAADQLARYGWEIDLLETGSNGVIDVDKLSDSLKPTTRLVVVMLGNNETGALQPVRQVVEICRPAGIPVHTDAAQCVGKLPVHFRELGVTTLSVAAHKFHGPVGVGALIVRSDANLAPEIVGGSQQLGLRGGTEPVALTLGMAKALELWDLDREATYLHLQRLRDRLQEKLVAAWPNAAVVAEQAPRLPNTLNIGLVGLDRQALMMGLDQEGVACSTGSACASGASEPSPTLTAMGCAPEVIRSALRFSVGVRTTAQDVDEAADRILRVAKRLKDL